MPSIIHQPHDKLFKQALADRALAQEFFEVHLPDKLRVHLDFKTLQLEKHSFIYETYKSSEADVVYSIQSDGQFSYIYLLCEHQSKIDAFIAFRLLTYMVRLWEVHHKKYPKAPLPLFYPLIVYSGKKPWNVSREFIDLFGKQRDLVRELLLEPFQLIDVYRIPDEELRFHLLSGLLEFTFFRNANPLTQ